MTNTKPSTLVVRIDFHPVGASTPTSLLTRAVSGPYPSIWPADTGRNALAFAVEEWQATTVLELDVTLAVEAGPERTICIEAVPIRGTAAVLGSVDPFRIDVRQGQTVVGPLRMCAVGVRIGLCHVGRHLVRWQWSATVGEAPAADVGVTEHLVYTVIGVPTLPWGQPPLATNAELPMIEALEYACRWAEGARVRDEAAASVTRRINELGGLGCTAFGNSTHFRTGAVTFLETGAIGWFEIDRFLAAMSGESVVEPSVDCEDLAAAVAVFANILGCRLTRLSVKADGDELIALNQVLVFGQTVPKDRLPHTTEYYFHQVAVAEDSGNLIFDALLMLDLDRDPARPPSSWSPVDGIPLKAEGRDYRRLLAPHRERLLFSWLGAPSVVVTADLAPPPPNFDRRFRSYADALTSHHVERGASTARIEWNQLSAYLASTSSLPTRTHASPTMRTFVVPTGGGATVVRVLDGHTRSTAIDLVAEVLASSPVPFASWSQPTATPVLVDSGQTAFAFVADTSGVFVTALTDIADLPSFVSQLLASAHS